MCSLNKHFDEANVCALASFKLIDWLKNKFYSQTFYIYSSTYTQTLMAYTIFSMVRHLLFSRSFSHILSFFLLLTCSLTHSFSHIHVLNTKRPIMYYIFFFSSSFSFNFMCIYRRRLCLRLWLHLYLTVLCATQFSRNWQKPIGEPPVRLMEINNDAFFFLLSISLSLFFAVAFSHVVVAFCFHQLYISTHHHPLSVSQTFASYDSIACMYPLVCAKIGNVFISCFIFYFIFSVKPTKLLQHLSIRL